jgi:hypothetical protein
MEMDWPSTFRTDLSIHTYQDLANVQPTGVLSLDSYIKGVGKDTPCNDSYEAYTSYR